MFGRRHVKLIVMSGWSPRMCGIWWSIVTQFMGGERAVPQGERDDGPSRVCVCVCDGGRGVPRPRDMGQVRINHLVI